MCMSSCWVPTCRHHHSRAVLLNQKQCSIRVSLREGHSQSAGEPVGQGTAVTCSLSGEAGLAMSTPAISKLIAKAFPRPCAIGLGFGLAAAYDVRYAQQHVYLSIKQTM